MKEVFPISKRRNSVTNSKTIQALETISREDSQQTSSFQNATTEFLKHCRIKGLSPATVKFFDKELKQMKRALTEINVPLSDVRKIKTPHIENFIEYQQS
ncbi:phage integrase N-terminal domain-containing protein [Niallia oryzisoli]|uniref:Phage integrase N-terminal domain-containing protein n=1 Tax=Niallia oryzisoli TaxID=1737571 RepID=A0ABZ2CEK4_9BACI